MCDDDHWLTPKTHTISLIRTQIPDPNFVINTTNIVINTTKNRYKHHQTNSKQQTQNPPDSRNNNKYKQFVTKSRNTQITL